MKIKQVLQSDERLFAVNREELLGTIYKVYLNLVIDEKILMLNLQ